MRLTLRTLLAYLDDTLEPAQAKLIGQKVAESETAQELIARIKLVTRRRRLTTPPEPGSDVKLDANAIAEYLDNALTGEEITRVEEICLESDVYLAEVAACHQILTLILGEPVRVPPTARQRMYGLIKGREAIPNRSVKVPKNASPSLDELAANEEEDEALLLGLPLYRRDGGIAQWRVPLAVACLIVAAAIATWMALRSGGPPALAVARPGEEQPVVVVHQQQKPQPAPVVPQEPQQDLAEEKMEVLPPPVAEEDAKPVPQKEPDAGSSKKPDLGRPRPPAPVSASPSTVRQEVGRYGQQRSILIQRAQDTEPWHRLKPLSRVATTDSLVSLPGFRSELNLDTGVQLLLCGNAPEPVSSPPLEMPPPLESAVTLYANPAVDLEFLLDHGRVVLSNHKKDGAATVRVRFQDEIWDIVLPDAKTEVALELVGSVLPYTNDPGGGEPLIEMRLYALQGQAQLWIRYEEHILPSPSVFSWDNRVGLAGRPRPALAAPEWWTKKKQPSAALQAALDGLFNLVNTRDKMEVAVAEIKNKSDPASHIVALRCQGAMNALPELLDALSDEKADIRARTIEVLRHFLGLKPKNEKKLYQALRQKTYTDEQTQTILQLLHGFSDLQWADPGLRRTIVDNLHHEKLAIRQLAHSTLLAMVPGRRINYDPAGSSEQRERGSNEWEKEVLGGK